MRHTNPILSTEMSDSCVFSTSKIWHPNQTRKFYENLHFLLENFFSNASKIFFMSPTQMFKVSKRCVLPWSLRRKKNESHPTHRSKYFWKKLTPQTQWIFNLIWRDVIQVFWMLYIECTWELFFFYCPNFGGVTHFTVYQIFWALNTFW